VFTLLLQCRRGWGSCVFKITWLDVIRLLKLLQYFLEEAVIRTSEKTKAGHSDGHVSGMSGVLASISSHAVEGESWIVILLMSSSKYCCAEILCLVES